MNISLLRKIQKAILRHPDQFEMSYFFQSELAMPHKHIKAGGCGTAACIAGWAVHLESNNRKLNQTSTESQSLPAKNLYNGIWFAAMSLLGLAADQARCLCMCDGWPSPFKNDYRYAETPYSRAKIAVKRIDHFIKTKGKE